MNNLENGQENRDEEVKQILVEMGVVFEVFWERYREKNKNLVEGELTESDLIAEIIAAGQNVAEEDFSFEDIVMTGTHIMGEDLHLFDE